jgi:acetate---CoA ligase (ADP-forming)
MVERDAAGGAARSGARKLRDDRLGQWSPVAPGLSRLAAADLEALADTLVRVSCLAMHIEGHLAELDINPLMVLPSGQGVEAVVASSCYAAYRTTTR